MKGVILILIISLILSIKGFSQNLDFMGIPTSLEKTNTDFCKPKEIIQAENPVILNSFASPINLPTDIASDQNNLYVVGYNEFKIYVIDKNTGDVTSTIPLNMLKPYGISVYNNYAYVLDNINHKIVKINLQTETVEDSTFLSSTNSYPTGIVYTNGSVWINDARGASPSTPNDTTLNFEFNGQFLKGNRAKGDYPTGLAWDGTYLYSTDNVAQIIYKLDPNNFEVLEEINAPGGNYPNGLSFDGNNLWLINNASDSIYQISVNQNITNTTDFDVNNNLKLYPNPADNYVVIDYNEPFTMNIFDIAGNLILTSNDKKTQVSGLKQGIYFVSIKNKAGKLLNQKKLVIVR